MPGFKPTPMGSRPKPTPQPKPPGWWLGRFQPTHAPTQAPYPIALGFLIEIWCSWVSIWGWGCNRELVYFMSLRSAC
ncbi:hypothetical protein Hanom_Chr01g00039111 [Helianthus anomalus]